VPLLALGCGQELVLQIGDGITHKASLVEVGRAELPGRGSRACE
jgi:hypothetical protein